MKTNRAKRLREKSVFLVSMILICVGANSFLFLRKKPEIIPVFILMLLAGFLLPLYSQRCFPNKKIRICDYGSKCLVSFLVSAVVSFVFHVACAFRLFPNEWKAWVISALMCLLTETVLFWNGIICVYATSIQLGIKLRVLGILFGFMPIVNLVLLIKIIRTTNAEVDFETEKHKVNVYRKESLICSTKYPILLVHGVFFRDTKLFNYWGRTPQELEANGARIYYGEQESAASAKDSAMQLAERIKSIVSETGCEKVNIIAHSKGGLDCRYAICHLDVAPYVASLITINTPHAGCSFADYLLKKVPEPAKIRVANTYNAAMGKLGDKNPDFLGAVNNLTAEWCTGQNDEMSIPESIYCKSVGSKMNRSAGGKFPLNLSYAFAKHFDGPNDGLVGENSFRYGKEHVFLTSNGKRGISHGDMIDLNRENIPGFDVREFYVQLVSDLKQRGL